MGIFKDLLLGGSNEKEDRKEKTERIDIRGTDERQDIYDSQGHFVEERRWNPRTDRWDRLDIHGDVIGHIERNSSGDMVHKDYYENVTRVDKREDSRTVAHYDSKGNKTGYTSKDYSNNLTRHTNVEEEKKSGSGLLGFFKELADDAYRIRKETEELRRCFEDDTDYDDEYDLDDEADEDDLWFDDDDEEYDDLDYDEEDDDEY